MDGCGALRQVQADERRDRVHRVDDQADGVSKMLCYKYMSFAKFKESIKPDGIFLKVSRPVEFNDPFDCVGRITGCPSESLIRSFNRRKVNSSTAWNGRNIQFSLSIATHSRRIFDRWYRIFSVCDADIVGTPAEMLMWAHYGDSAKGVRVGIEVDENSQWVENIAYEEMMPTLDLQKVQEWSPFEDEVLKRFLRGCLLTKHEVWNYEKERRVIFRVDDECLRSISSDDSDTNVETMKFVWSPSKTSIKEVCLGAEYLSGCKGREEINERSDEFSQLVVSLRKNGYKFRLVNAIRVGHYCYDQVFDKTPDLQ